MKASKTETGFQQPKSGLQKSGINIPSFKWNTLQEARLWSGFQAAIPRGRHSQLPSLYS